MAALVAVDAQQRRAPTGVGGPLLVGAHGRPEGAPRHPAPVPAPTNQGWRSWSALHQAYQGPYAELVHHSGRVLQALTYAPTGAVVAAPTTSLPEEPGGGRNWDYRYTWVRDASLTLSALWVAACPDEVADFFGFFVTAAGGTPDSCTSHLSISDARGTRQPVARIPTGDCAGTGPAMVCPRMARTEPPRTRSSRRHLLLRLPVRHKLEPRGGSKASGRRGHGGGPGHVLSPCPGDRDRRASGLWNILSSHIVVTTSTDAWSA